jgi:hypothetical protein
MASRLPPRRGAYPAPHRGQRAHDGLSGSSSESEEELFNSPVRPSAADGRGILPEERINASSPWVAYLTAEGKRYYHNTRTNVTEWRVPLGTPPEGIQKSMDGSATQDQSVQQPVDSAVPTASARRADPSTAARHKSENVRRGDSRGYAVDTLSPNTAALRQQRQLTRPTTR